MYALIYPTVCLSGILPFFLFPPYLLLLGDLLHTSQVSLLCYAYSIYQSFLEQVSSGEEVFFLPSHTFSIQTANCSNCLKNLEDQTPKAKVLFFALSSKCADSLQRVSSPSEARKLKFLTGKKERGCFPLLFDWGLLLSWKSLSCTSFKN